MASKTRIPLPERLLRHTEENDAGCWIWVKSLDKDGYGKFQIARDGDWKNGVQHVRPHRLAYEVWVGEIPQGDTIDHLCRNRACINPDHLEAVSSYENIMRGDKGDLKTHCMYGHPLAGENLYEYEFQGRQWRGCRTCRRKSSREFQRRKRANL